MQTHLPHLLPQQAQQGVEKDHDPRKLQHLFGSDGEQVGQALPAAAAGEGPSQELEPQ